MPCLIVVAIDEVELQLLTQVVRFEGPEGFMSAVGPNHMSCVGHSINNLDNASELVNFLGPLWERKLSGFFVNY